MNKNKLLVLIILLAVVFANFRTTSASAATLFPPPREHALTLSVSFSPITIYPPLMLFTATLNPIPPFLIDPILIEYYLVVDAPVMQSPGMKNLPQDPVYEYLGSAPLHPNGKALFSKQMNPGTYTAVARVVTDVEVIWSNQFTFTIPFVVP